MRVEWNASLCVPLHRFHIAGLGVGGKGPGVGATTQPSLYLRGNSGPARAEPLKGHARVGGGARRGSWSPCLLSITQQTWIVPGTGTRDSASAPAGGTPVPRESGCCRVSDAGWHGCARGEDSGRLPKR